MTERVFRFEVDAQFDGLLDVRYPKVPVARDLRRVAYVDTDDFLLASRGRAHALVETADGARAFDDSAALNGVGMGGLPLDEPANDSVDLAEDQVPEPAGNRQERPDTRTELASESGRAENPNAERLAERLRSIFSVEIGRTIRTVLVGRHLEVEIAVESAEVRVQGTNPLQYRSQVRCVRGRPDRFHRWLLALGRVSCLRLECEPVVRMGLSALKAPLRPPMAARYVAPQCWPKQRVNSTASSAIRACLAQMVGNVWPILHSEDVEGPHQFRIGIRRLRAQLRLFELASRQPGWEPVIRTARELAMQAGNVRECDVFEREHLGPMRDLMPGDLALWGLADGLSRLRSHRRADARSLLKGPTFCAFVLNVEYLCARLEQADTETELADFARHRLHELDGRLKRRVDAAHDAATWHRARLAAKDLRYAIEAVAPAVDHPSRARKAITLMTRLQDELGRLQDRRDSLAIAHAAADEYLMDGGMRTRACALVEGWIAALSKQDSGSAQDAAEQLKRGRRALRGLISHKRRIGQ